MQTRAHSLLEASLNTASGFVLAYLVQLGVVWHYQLPLRPGQSLGITLVFTAISVVRSYLWRRFFNRRLVGPPTGLRWSAQAPLWLLGPAAAGVALGASVVALALWAADVL